jgi:homoserine acetyltransferase
MKTDMRNTNVKNLIAGLTLGAACLLPVAGWAFDKSKIHAITPPSAAMNQDHLKLYYEIPNFRIGGKYNLDANPETWRDGGEGGTTLESLGAPPLKVGYIAVGTPQRNDRGEITNAVIINTYYSGDSTWMYNTWFEGQPLNAFSDGAIVGPGRTIDTNRFYVVFLDALGLWGESKPSAGLGRKFPQYNYFDMVQANYRLLRDHLKVAQVEVATGVSMGATQAWVWGVMYSPGGFVKAIMPIGGTTASDGDDPVGQWTFRLGQAAIESDPIWRQTSGNYYHLPEEKHPKQGLIFMWSLLQLTGYTFPVRSATPWSTLQKEVFYWQPKGDESLTYINRTKNEDPVDYWYRNQAGFNHNINKELKRIKARTLVVHVDTDLWLMVENARKAAAQVQGAHFASFPHPAAHYGVFKAPNIIRDTIQAFVEDAFTSKLPGIGGVSGGGGAPVAEAKPSGLAK